MFTVSIYTLKNFKDTLLGKFKYDGKSLSMEPAESEELKVLAERPLNDPEEGLVSAKDNPKRWMTLLHDNYSSAYLRASPIDQTKEGMNIKPSPFAARQKSLSNTSTKGWITIGGNDCPDGKRHHCGGRAVYVNSQGEITRAPPKLLGSRIHDIAGGNKDKTPKTNDSPLKDKAPESPKVKPTQLERTQTSEESKGDFLKKLGKPKNVTVMIPGGMQSKTDTQKIMTNMKELFHKDNLTTSDIGAMTCAPDGALVRVDTNPTGTTLAYNGEGVAVTRIFEKTAKGVVCKNNFFSIDKSSPHKGQGAYLFAKQVAALKEAGVVAIKTYALGRKASLGDANGYYTWPRLGYDGTIPEHSYSNLPNKIKQKLGKNRSVLDLMALPGGKEAWLEHGSSVADAHFDLSDGSRSLKALENYLNEREKNRGVRSKES